MRLSWRAARITVALAVVGQVFIVWAYLCGPRNDHGMLWRGTPEAFLWGSSIGLWISVLIYAPLVGWFFGEQPSEFSEIVVMRRRT